MERASVGWHEVSDPQADRWSVLKALLGALDHVSCVAHNSVIHIIDNRFNTFEYSTNFHHVCLRAKDAWEERAPEQRALAHRVGHHSVGG